MATKKTTKKAEKDMLYIDAEKCLDSKSTKTTIAIAKINQGKPITQEDFQTLVNDITATTINVLFAGCNAVIRLEDGRLIRTTLVPESEATDEVKEEAKENEKKGFFSKLKDKFKK